MAWRVKTPQLTKVMLGIRHWGMTRGIVARTSLLNPFELASPDAGSAARQQAPRNRGSRATPVCAHCHSDDITCSATVQWSNESQEWQLANTFEMPARCNSCDRPSELTWLPLN